MSGESQRNEENVPHLSRSMLTAMCSDTLVGVCGDIGVLWILPHGGENQGKNSHGKNMFCQVAKTSINQ